MQNKINIPFISKIIILIFFIIFYLYSYGLATTIRTTSNNYCNEIKIKINFPLTKVAFALRENLSPGLTPFHITQNGT